jgi:Tfp pilus assembly protein PilN
MRININLASRKYEEVRQFFFRWGVTLVALAGMTVLLATLAFFSHSRAVKSLGAMKEMQRKVTALQKQRDRLIDFEKRPENLDINQQRKFWNVQIAKRNLSWTRLLNDLQRIMPDRAYLSSVQPELTRDNRLKLRLVIVGEKREDARELEKRMEDSVHFHAPHIDTETRQKEERSRTDIWKFEIETEYAPATATPQPQSPHDRQAQGAPETSRAKEAS